MGKPGLDVVLKADISVLVLALACVLIEFSGPVSKLANHLVDRWIVSDLQNEAMKTPKRDHVGSLGIEQHLP